MGETLRATQPIKLFWPGSKQTMSNFLETIFMREQRSDQNFWNKTAHSGPISGLTFDLGHPGRGP